jgi:hypothetical protein
MLRKQSWRNFWNYVGIFMKGQRKTTKALVLGTWFQSSHCSSSSSVTVRGFLVSSVVELPSADRRGE